MFLNFHRWSFFREIFEHCVWVLVYFERCSCWDKLFVCAAFRYPVRKKMLTIIKSFAGVWAGSANFLNLTGKQIWRLFKFAFWFLLRKSWKSKVSLSLLERFSGCSIIVILSNILWKTTSASKQYKHYSLSYW